VVELMGELNTLERIVRMRILFGDRPPAELQSMLARRRLRFRRGLVALARRPGALAPGRGSMTEGERQLARAIEARRREPTGDLLSALVASGIPAAQVRAEVLMTLTAGSGAAARGEAWTLWEMAERPEMAERIGGGDIEFTKTVVAEVMRLRPPSPLIVSHARLPDRLPSGRAVSAGTKMLISPLILHRNPAHFPDPGRFDPARFAPAARKARPRFHYLPFGAGARNCIGRELALLETVTLASVVAQRFELEPAGPGPEAVPPAPPRSAAPVHVRAIAR
jgi:cytochrome P450